MTCQLSGIKLACLNWDLSCELIGKEQRIFAILEMFDGNVFSLA